MLTDDEIRQAVIEVQSAPQQSVHKTITQEVAEVMVTAAGLKPGQYVITAADEALA